MMMVALMAAGCGSALHTVANVSEVVAYGSLACDAGSTRWAMHAGGYAEVNPVMGAEPSSGMIAGYFTGISSAVFGMNRAFSVHHEAAGDVWRVATNLVVLAMEQDAIRGNHDAGVPLCGY